MEDFTHQPPTPDTAQRMARAQKDATTWGKSDRAAIEAKAAMTRLFNTLEMMRPHMPHGEAMIEADRVASFIFSLLDVADATARGVVGVKPHTLAPYAGVINPMMEVEAYPGELGSKAIILAATHWGAFVKTEDGEVMGLGWDEIGINAAELHKTMEAPAPGSAEAVVNQAADLANDASCHLYNAFNGTEPGEDTHYFNTSLENAEADLRKALDLVHKMQGAAPAVSSDEVEGLRAVRDEVMRWSKSDEDPQKCHNVDFVRGFNAAMDYLQVRFKGHGAVIPKTDAPPARIPEPGSMKPQQTSDQSAYAPKLLRIIFGYLQLRKDVQEMMNEGEGAIAPAHIAQFTGDLQLHLFEGPAFLDIAILTHYAHIHGFLSGTEPLPAMDERQELWASAVDYSRVREKEDGDATK